MEVVLWEKDISEKRPEDHADVFSDLVNTLLFKGRRLIQPEDLLSALPRSIYKMDTKVHEQERDVAKFWMKGQQGVQGTRRGNEACEEGHGASLGGHAGHSFYGCVQQTDRRRETDEHGCLDR